MDANNLPNNDVVEMNEERILIEWEAAERSYQKRNKDFWVTAIAILILVSVILIFIKEFFLIMALISVLFLYYALSSVPPEKIKNKLTNRGLYFGELRYEWKDLKRFWFKKSMSSDTINFGTSLKFPRVISLVIDSKDTEKLKEIVVKRIPLLESSPTFIDRLTQWFASRLPLEDREATKKGN